MELLIGIVIGIVIGAISWQIGMIIANNYRHRHGADHCIHCGKPWDSEI